MSYLEQDSDQFISSPDNGLSLPDTVTAVMRDQTGAPVSGLPAGGCAWRGGAWIRTRPRTRWRDPAGTG